LIRVQHLNGGYDSKVIVNDVSFEICKGEFFALLGPNGSGKSTILKLITGALPIQSGDVQINGRSLLSYSSIEKAKLMTVLTQEETISFDFTVEEIISLGRYPHQTGLFKTLSSKDMAVIEEAMEITRVSQYRKTLFHSLSGGEKQRVLLAKALAQEPHILLLDEPTNHLDIQHTFHLLNLIKEWQKTKGMTVLAILHDLNVASLYSDRIALLQEGKIHQIGSVHLLKKEEQLKEVYQVEVTSQSHPTIPKPQLFLTPKHGLDNGLAKSFKTTYQIDQNPERIHIQFENSLRTISNGVLGEGVQWVKHFCNYHVHKYYNCDHPKDDILEWMQKEEIPQEQSVGMMTAVTLEDRAICEQEIGGISYLVVVTAGVSNAVDITSAYSVTSPPTYKAGTINTMLFIDAHFSDGALVNAMISATEAKTKALSDLAIVDQNTGTIATGTSTDSLLIATTQVGEITPYAGSGTLVGKGIGEIVYTTTKQAILNYQKRIQERSV
jgi:iron complex transport system ATP-binding protein